MELLLWPPEGHAGGWTSPRWMTEGDIFLFYHTKKALKRITRLLKTALDADDEDWLTVSNPDQVVEILSDQLEIAREYAGTIFGCAVVAGPATFYRDADREGDQHRHWRSNIYAPVQDVHIFEHPVSDAAFRQYVTISPGGAVTPAHGQAFDRLRELLAATNELPTYLANARSGGISFREVNSTTWRDISCSATARFIDESQLRAYLLDYLLEELKDAGTTVYQECRCGLDRKHLSVADYFVRVAGVWLPVEAKLNVRAEQDLVGQVANYLNVGEFHPTRGKGSGEVVRGPGAGLCLVADVAGLYLVDADGYVQSSAENPLWPRTALDRSIGEKVREHLSGLCP